MGPQDLVEEIPCEVLGPSPLLTPKGPVTLAVGLFLIEVISRDRKPDVGLPLSFCSKWYTHCTYSSRAGDGGGGVGRLGKMTACVGSRDRLRCASHCASLLLPLLEVESGWSAHTALAVAKCSSVHVFPSKLAAMD